MKNRQIEFSYSHGSGTGNKPSIAFEKKMAEVIYWLDGLGCSVNAAPAFDELWYKYGSDGDYGPGKGQYMAPMQIHFKGLHKWSLGWLHMGSKTSNITIDNHYRRKEISKDGTLKECLEVLAAYLSSAEARAIKRALLREKRETAEHGGDAMWRRFRNTMEIDLGGLGKRFARKEKAISEKAARLRNARMIIEHWQHGAISLPRAVQEIQRQGFSKAWAEKAIKGFPKLAGLKKLKSRGG